MRISYDKHIEGDHVTVQTGSVARWIFTVMRYAFAFVFALAVIGDLATGHLFAAVWPFLLFAVVLPKRRRHG